MKRNCVFILHRARLASESGNPFQDGGQIHEYAMLKLSVFQGVFYGAIPMASEEGSARKKGASE